MLQRGCCFRLGLQAPDKLVTGELAEEQHLHRDNAVEADLPSSINDPHAAARDFLDQLVVAKKAWRRVSVCRLWGKFVFLLKEKTDSHAEETSWTKPSRRGSRKFGSAFVTYWGSAGRWCQRLR